MRTRVSYWTIPTQLWIKKINTGFKKGNILISTTHHKTIKHFHQVLFNVVPDGMLCKHMTEIRGAQKTAILLCYWKNTIFANIIQIHYHLCKQLSFCKYNATFSKNMILSFSSGVLHRTFWPVFITRRIQVCHAYLRVFFPSFINEESCISL